MQQTYGLKYNTEFHTFQIFRANNPEYKAIKKSERINMLKFYINEIPEIFTDAKVLNICLKKAEHPEILNFQELAWHRMLQTYDHYLKKAVDDKGIIISDESNEHQLRASRNQCDNPVLNIIEDISYRKSNLSYFIQTCDAIAYCLYLKEYPKVSLKNIALKKYSTR